MARPALPVAVAIVAAAVAALLAACGGSGGSEAGICALAEEAETAEPGAGLTSDRIDAAIGQAPSVIEDDVEVLAKAYSDHSALTRDLDPTDPADDADMAQAAEIFADPNVVRAGQRVNDYVEERCNAPS